jgi:nitrite reductase/ring-hydroxylating ferredoxin subunit
MVLVLGFGVSNVIVGWPSILVFTEKGGRVCIWAGRCETVGRPLEMATSADETLPVTVVCLFH